jgi:hypothetical protein
LPDQPVNTQQQQMPDFKNAPNFRQIYCNSVNMDVTPWEFKFTFGNIVKPQPGQTRPVIENAIEITASPQLAKVFLNILANNMAEYEKNVGEVKTPPIAPPVPKQ